MYVHKVNIGESWKCPVRHSSIQVRSGFERNRRHLIPQPLAQKVRGPCIPEEYPNIGRTHYQINKGHLYTSGQTDEEKIDNLSYQ